MRTNLSGFRKFVEDMDQSVEKKMGGNKDSSDNTKMDYFGGLGDEMGMEWKDIVQSLEREPWVSAHFGLGSPKHELMYKKSAWKIVPGSMSANGADIMLVPNRGDRSYLKGGKMLNKGKPDTKTYHISREQLIKFLTGGWQPAVDAAQGGGAAAGGMPGAPGAPPGGAAPPGGMPGMPGMPGGM
jgi:hypothetical protein